MQARTNEQRALREKDEAEAARASALQARDEVQQNLYNAEMYLAAQATESAGGMGRVNTLLSHWRPAVGEPDRRFWEWYYLHGLSRRALP